MKKLATACLFSSSLACLGQGSQLVKYTVATLPSASSYPTYTVQVIDGTTSTDCTVGGGSNNVLCTVKSGAWVPVTGITQLTGDVTATGPGSAAATLATVNSDTGTCGDATHVGKVTLNAKGLATACTPVSITSSGSGITALTGDVTATGPGSAAASVTKIEGGAIPASALFGGWNSSHQPTTSTTADLASFLSGLTGCSTATYPYVPADSECEAPSGAAFYQTVQANGSSKPQEAKLNLISGANSTVSCADNPGATSTDCTVSSTGGPVPTVVDTSTPVTVSTTNVSEFHFNQNATAATAVTYDLPTAAAGKQFCFSNSYNGSAANTGTLELLTSASGQFIIYTDGTLSATGGFVISTGAAADAACVVGVDSTHWMLYTTRGTWAKH